ncbi:MAG: N-6 DNA methylase [Gemmatimonadota bacterium]
MGRAGASGGRELAQHFTPPGVARLMCRLAGAFAGSPAEGWRVADPAAGEGALLRAALDCGAQADRVCGVELDGEVAARAAAHGLEIEVGDGLTGPWPVTGEGTFDVILGNPPFGRCGKLLSESQQAAILDGAPRAFGIWRAAQGPGALASPTAAAARLRAAAVEHLFLERALQLVRPGGLVVYVLPQGLLSNSRTQAVRDWIQERAELLVVAGLPEGAFRGPGLNATTGVLVMRRHQADPAEGPAALVAPRRAGRGGVSASLEDLERRAEKLVRGARRVPGGLRLRQARLRGRRWDVEYWLADPEPILRRYRHRLARFGDYVTLLTYGPIVTGQRPTCHPGGVRLIGQGDFTETGLAPAVSLRVEAGSVHDPPRSRVRCGDLLLPRSGAGALGRNRVAVYDEKEEANIGCFVDLVRLAGLNPYYAWVYLRTEGGWGQIRRLINGVGVPNISFAEIRSLQVPLLDAQEQAAVEERYRREVLPCHRMRHAGTDAARVAEARFHCLVADLEQYLRGGCRDALLGTRCRLSDLGDVVRFDT